MSLHYMKVHKNKQKGKEQGKEEHSVRGEIGNTHNERGREIKDTIFAF